MELSLSKVFDYIIYSDGSAHSSTSGAAACIVEDTNTLKRYYLTTSFGQSTNNQAEVFATLIGYAFIKSISTIPWKTRIQLVSDSEYTLHSTTQYVPKWKKSGKLYGSMVPLKNRYFWQLFDRLTDNFEITGKHVKGHSDHFDNERCDNAASWARIQRIESGAENEYIVELIKKKRKVKMFNDNWFYYDTGSLFEILTTEDTTVAPDVLKVQSELIEKTSKYTEEGSDLKLVTTQDRALKAIMDKVKEAVTMAHKYKASDKRISGLESKLLNVIQEYKDEYY